MQADESQKAVHGQEPSRDSFRVQPLRGCTAVPEALLAQGGSWVSLQDEWLVSLFQAGPSCIPAFSASVRNCWMCLSDPVAISRVAPRCRLSVK